MCTPRTGSDTSLPTRRLSLARSPVGLTTAIRLFPCAVQEISALPDSSTRSDGAATPDASVIAPPAAGAAASAAAATSVSRRLMPESCPIRAGREPGRRPPAGAQVRVSVLEVARPDTERLDVVVDGRATGGGNGLP